ncbi:hypothetical protein [Micromonospora sp. DT233]|uniref:hypothetical protein n=1 Tax=Micromonospora sp. DT233 TaxID=3393432 RepID=UPI003CF91940
MRLTREVMVVERSPRAALWAMVVGGSLVFLGRCLDGFDGALDVVVGLLTAGLVVWAALTLRTKRRKDPGAGA